MIQIDLGHARIQNAHDHFFAEVGRQRRDAQIEPPAFIFDQDAPVLRNAPFGVALTKEGMWSALEIPGMQAAIDLENRQQIMASFSQDAAEARSARAERRAPDYQS